MSELKRCPFCGGEAEIRKRHIKYNGVVTMGFEIKCKRCCMRSMAFFEKEEAIETWNTRKPVENVLERLENLVSIYMGNSEKAAELGTKYEKHMILNGAKGCAFEEAIEIVKEIMEYD